MKKALKKERSTKRMFLAYLAKVCNEHMLISQSAIREEITEIYVDIVLHGGIIRPQRAVPISSIPNYLSAPIECLAEQIVEQIICGSKSDDEDSDGD